MSVKNILVIDDGEAEQFLCKIVIEDVDPLIQVLQAMDGRQALNIIQELKQLPDMILLDINMPGMGGFEFLKAYESLARSSCFVAVLTSSSQQQDKEMTQTYNCVKAYVEKPLTKNDMLELIALASKNYADQGI